MSKKKKIKLKVVFDTNAIYSGTESFLLNNQVSEFITENSKHFDIDISWYLPEMVINERKFQMIEKGIKLLIPIQKLETLLGHKLNINEEVITSNIDLRIAEQLKKYSISNIELDISMVDWKTIMNNSVKRIAPFENSQTEKGFRDSVILETFDQIVNSSPKTPSVCKIVFVCNDNLLIEAVKDRVKQSKNVRTVSDLSNLKGLINTLVSDIEETVINNISKIASEMFFTEKSEDSLYFKEPIRKLINSKYSNEINVFPDSQTIEIEQGTWYISSVSFIKKVKQRIFWSSPITIDLIAYKNGENYIFKDNFGFLPKNNFSLFGTQSSLFADSENLSNALISTGQAIPSQAKPTTYIGSKQIIGNADKIIHLKGNSKFEVIWSVTYGVNKKLSNPKIESINFIENEWNL